MYYPPLLYENFDFLVKFGLTAVTTLVRVNVEIRISG